MFCKNNGGMTALIYAKYQKDLSTKREILSESN